MGTTASSNIPSPILQVLWPCVQFLHMEPHPRRQWILAVGQGDHSALTAHGWAMLFNTMPMDMATVRSKKLLVKLEPEEFYLILREIHLNFLDMWYILVVHSVSMWLKHWWKAQARGGDMKTTDRERPVMRGSSMYNRRSHRKKQLEIVCDIFYSCS